MRGKKILYFFLLTACWLLCRSSVANNSMPPWLDLEKRLQVSEKKVLEIEAELQDLLKKREPFATADAKRLHFEKIRSLREEKKELLEDIERIKRDLKFRFPERGVLVKTKTSAEKKESATSEKQEGEKEGLKQDQVRSKSVGPNPELLKELQSVVKQNYGVTESVTPSFHKSSDSSQAVENATNSNLPKDSIFAPLLIQKEKGENP